MRPFRRSRLTAFVFAFLAGLGAVVAGEHALEEPLQPGTAVRTATAEEGGRVLARRDAYIRAMAPHERALLMGEDEPPTEEEFLAFLGRQALPWEPQEVRHLPRQLGSIREKLAARGLALTLPAAILLVKTTGRDMCSTPYTRANAILLPRFCTERQIWFLEDLLIHELFHIWSRHNPALRHRLYRVIHFQRCGRVAYPEELADRRYTNPDAPHVEHAADVEHRGQRLRVTPVIYLKERWREGDPLVGVFGHLTWSLLVLERRGDEWRAKRAGGRPWLLPFREVPDFFEKVGWNTHYVIHPEEILAENFVLLVNGEADVRSPWVLEGMRRVLARPAAEQGAPR